MEFGELYKGGKDDYRSGNLVFSLDSCLQEDGTHVVYSLAALYEKKENPSHQKKKKTPNHGLCYFSCSACFSWTTFFWERD
jgi:hypothetical protein